MHSPILTNRRVAGQYHYLWTGQYDKKWNTTWCIDDQSQDDCDVLYVITNFKVSLFICDRHREIESKRIQWPASDFHLGQWFSLRPHNHSAIYKIASEFSNLLLYGKFKYEKGEKINKGWTNATRTTHNNSLPYTQRVHKLFSTILVNFPRPFNRILEIQNLLPGKKRLFETKVRCD